jgi:hypothetical protein
MNNSELEKLLKSARAPEWTDEYWDDFPRRVRARIAAGAHTGLPANGASRVPWLTWGLGLATACLMIGFAVGHWQGRRAADSFALLQNGKTLREILTLFPNRVRAIEQDEHGMQLVLSDHPDVPASTPLWIKICDGQHCRAVVTFSGQNLRIAKEQVEVLLDARGQVLLVGDRFVWSSSDPVRAPDALRIQAHPVDYTL